MEQRRGKLILEEEKREILKLIKNACEEGADQQAACDIVGISPKTIQRWKCRQDLKDGRSRVKTLPHNKLTENEKEQILHIVNQEKYASLSPAQIVPLLADEGLYLASESTFYRILKAENQLNHRHKNKPRVVNKPKALKADAPNQIYSWDITYLKSNIVGRFFYLYLIMDIYSRKIVGWQIYEKESAEYASDVLESACREEGIEKGQVILHSDNGSPMKGAVMLATMQRLGVVPSFSRPAVSNDNPYSEALFRTLKYTPMFPEEAFETLEIAREWMNSFIKWYNYKHLHSGIKFVTPIQRHTGYDERILQDRDLVYKKAQENNPYRWSKNTRNWNKNKEVLLNPEKHKILENQLKVAV